VGEKNTARKEEIQEPAGEINFIGSHALNEERISYGGTSLMIRKVSGGKENQLERGAGKG